MAGLLDFLLQNSQSPAPGGLLGNMGQPSQQMPNALAGAPPFKSNMLDASGQPVTSDPNAPPMAMYAPGSVPQIAEPQQNPLGHLPSWLQQFLQYNAMVGQMNAERHRSK